MILKIRSSKEGENWHFIDHIARMTLSNRKQETLSHFQRRVFRVDDVVLISESFTWDEVDGRKGMKSPETYEYDPSKNPLSPHYTGPELSEEEVLEATAHITVQPGEAVMEKVLKMDAEALAKRMEKTIQFYEARCADNDGKEFTIFFDGELFLLNDLGKTIDHFDPQRYPAQ